MYVSKYVFSQLTSFLNRSLFNDFVRKYKGGHYVKHFTCWNQLLVMIFGQLSNRESLRDLIVALEANQPKCYHMSTGYKPVTKTTLARVNQDRDYRIFEDFAFYMMAQARSKCVVDIFNLNGNVYAFDFTTIPLCLAVFWWAKFRKRKGGREGSFPLRFGNFRAGVLPHHEGLGSRFQGDVRDSLRVRFVLCVRPWLQRLQGTLQDSQEGFLLHREGQEKPPVQVRQMAATSGKRAH